MPSTKPSLFLVPILALLINPTVRADGSPKILARENLVAWCIVPFDAAERGPSERCKMLKDLGIRRYAYDWRAKHVPEFEREILAAKKAGLEFFAFWSSHEDAFRLFEKHKIQPQVWQTLADPGEMDQSSRVHAAANQLLRLAEQTQTLGCKLGLYNHGGWGGEPANLVAVCERLRELGFPHVGIVYNFHHAHDHIDDWEESLDRMMPYLHCLNLNGMATGGTPKILGLGKGQREVDMIQAIVRSGYEGPIGILDHRPEMDARESLEENLQGLRLISKELIGVQSRSR